MFVLVVASYVIITLQVFKFAREVKNAHHNLYPGLQKFIPGFIVQFWTNKILRLAKWCHSVPGPTLQSRKAHLTNNPALPVKSHTDCYLFLSNVFLPLQYTASELR